MTGSAARDVDAGRVPAMRQSARARPSALALVASWLIVLVPAARAQVDPGTSVASAPDTGAVERYGPVSDSVVRARCEGATIRRVDVHSLDIFDPVPAGRFSAAYRLANRLHVRTRSGTVRSQLLLAPGQLWTADGIAESQRLLRELEYIEPDAIVSRLERDSVDVLVVTHDQWTTQPELNLERGGGRTFGSVGFTERNLFGLGLGVAVAFHEEPTGRTRSGQLSGRRLFGTTLEGQASAGTGTGGVSNAFSLRDPFRSLDDDQSWAVSFWRSTSQAQLFEAGALAARFPFRFEQAVVEYGIGRRFTDGLVRRFSFGFTRNDRHYGPTEPEPGTDPARFAGGTEDLTMRWLSARVVFWKPHYIERRGVELFDPIEDFDVGSLVGMEGGFVLRMLGSTADEGLARLRFETGRETRRFGFGFARGRLSTRIRGAARETQTHLDARWVQQPARDVALVLAVFGEALDRGTREQQLVVGGLNGLRAYPVQALAGTEVWRFNAETRWVSMRDVWNLASIGGAVFMDAARAWGPGSDDGPWHRDAGFGLRLSFPHASLHQVARFDVAFPLSPSRDGRREPVFSFGSSQAF